MSGAQDFTPVTVSFLAGGDDEEALISASEDLAWEAAVNAANIEGVEVGSDEFAAAYRLLQSRYRQCAESFAHLSFMSAITLKTLMDGGMALVYPDKEYDDKDIENYLQALVSVILSTVTSMYVTAPEGWMKNEDWNDLPKHKRTVTFDLMRPTNPSEENNEDHD